MCGYISIVTDLVKLAAILTIVGALAATISAPVASADVQNRSDPRGDTKGKEVGDAFDFRSARANHTERRGTVRHRATSWIRAGATGVRLELQTDDRPGADYYVTKPPGKRPVVRNVYTNERLRGRARFKKHTAKSFSFTFNLGFAGYPPVYKWRWVTVAKGEQTFDALPNSGFVRHRPIYGKPHD